MNNLLFSELIINYIKGNEENLDIAMKRLLSFGFDKITSANIIESEVEIIKRRRIKKIKDDYYLNNKTVLKLNIAEYDLFYKEKISNEALLISEIINIYYNAKQIILKNEDKYSYEIVEEINYINKKGIKSPLLELIYSRFNYMYHIENKSIPREQWIDNKKIDNFIKNELKLKKGN